ncbi:hypothetical protein NYR55_06285 [Sphingomonas sp. BGYR3]|uniref:hypothetical protein n=1 Tax=Sphingomonas sp. BGYR3 TaxID=2975483 RepID=UPI0021A2EE36|nr:hypothetical protein [Sphingomonas sp. BGYR3]MDG5488227.1 hypothetical protein [Sphingomonas sp. BGYR3]
MTLRLTEGFEVALTLLRRDRSVLIPLAGLFFAWPALALKLLVPPLDFKGVAQDAQLALVLGYLADHSLMLVLSMLMNSFGTAVILTLYLDPRRLDVGGAMIAALRSFPRYLTGVVLAGLVAGIGFFLLIVPGIYFTARAMMIGPRLIARADEPLNDAVGQAVAMTAKGGWMIAAMWLTILIGSFSANIVANGINSMAKATGSTGQIVELPAAFVLALASGAAGLALALLQVALYWRLAGSSRGI